MARGPLPSSPLGIVSSPARGSPDGRKRRMPPAVLATCAAGFNALCLGSRAPGQSPAPALPPQAREVVRQAAEGGVGDAVLHAARLL